MAKIFWCHKCVYKEQKKKEGNLVKILLIAWFNMYILSFRSGRDVLGSDIGWILNLLIPKNRLHEVHLFQYMLVLLHVILSYFLKVKFLHINAHQRRHRLEETDSLLHFIFHIWLCISLARKASILWRYLLSWLPLFEQFALFTLHNVLKGYVHVRGKDA